MSHFIQKVWTRVFAHRTKLIKFLDKQSLLFTFCVFYSDPICFLTHSQCSYTRTFVKKKHREMLFIFSPFVRGLTVNVHSIIHVYMQRSRIFYRNCLFSLRCCRDQLTRSSRLCTHFSFSLSTSAFHTVSLHIWVSVQLKLNILCEWQIIMLNTEMVLFCGGLFRSFTSCWEWKCFICIIVFVAFLCLLVFCFSSIVGLSKFQFEYMKSALTVDTR